MSNFKAADYSNYNQKFGFDKYKQLYDIMQELFNILPFNENDFEDDSFFVFSGMKVCIDKKFGSYCEIINSGWLPMDVRIKLHKKKLAVFKRDIIQLNLF